jgi:hypothetical protein
MEDKIDKFILDNYKSLGWSGCARALKLNRSTIYLRAKKLELSMPSESLSARRSQITLKRNSEKTQKNFEAFKTIDTPEKAYLLGYFWADGHLSKNTILMTIVREDLNNVKDIFLRTGDWTIKKAKKPTPQQKELSRIYICNQRLCNIFNTMGFAEKSFISASKVLSHIPKELHSYWLRGYFDGDGCVAFLKSGFGPRAFITSSYQQDWNGIEAIIKDLKIKYCIRRKNSKFKYLGKIKDGRSSELIISGRADIFKFFNYIYGDHLKRFGLKRKYNKFVDIFTRPMERKLQKNAFMEGKVFYHWN